MKKLFVVLVVIFFVMLIVLAALHVTARLIFPWPEPAAGVDLELQRSFAEPESLQPDNAFWYFAQLTNRIESPRGDMKSYRRYGMRGGPYPEFDAALESSRTGIDLFIRAAGLTNAIAEGCFDVNCIYPYLSATLGVGQLLGYRAERSAFSGDWNAAIADWQSLLRGGLHLQTAPGLIGYLVGVAVIHQAVASIHRAVEINHPPVQEIARLIDELQMVAGQCIPLTEVIRAERRMAHITVTKMYGRKSDVVGLVTGAAVNSALLPHILYPVLLFFGSSPEDTSKHVDSIYAHSIQIIDDEGTVDLAERKWNEITYGEHPYGRLAYFNDPVGRGWVRLFMVSVPTIYPREREHRQKLDFAVLHLKLLRYYLQYDVIPDTAEELVDCLGERLAADRFLPGRAIRYLREEGGWLLYSVGRDGIDQGGVISPAADEMQPPDLGSRFVITNAGGQ